VGKSQSERPNREERQHCFGRNGERRGRREDAGAEYALEEREAPQATGGRSPRHVRAPTQAGVRLAERPCLAISSEDERKSDVNQSPTDRADRLMDRYVFNRDRSIDDQFHIEIRGSSSCPFCESLTSISLESVHDEHELNPIDYFERPQKARTLNLLKAKNASLNAFEFIHKLIVSEAFLLP
jgi:hypothetical protein